MPDSAYAIVSATATYPTSRWMMRKTPRQRTLVVNHGAGAVDARDDRRLRDARRVVRLAVLLRLVLGVLLALLDRHLLHRHHALGRDLLALGVHREHHLAVRHLEAKLLTGAIARELHPAAALGADVRDHALDAHGLAVPRLRVREDRIDRRGLGELDARTERLATGGLRRR